MRKVLLTLLLIRLLTVSALALPEELLEALPDDARILLEETQEESVEGTLNSGGKKLLELGQALLSGAATAALGPAVLIMGATMLCSVAESMYQGTGNDKVPDFVPFAGVLTVTAAVAGSVETMVGLGRETIAQLQVFSLALLPTLAAAVSASGGIVSASVRQVSTVWVSGVLITVINDVLLPLVYCYIAVSAANGMTPRTQLKGIGEGIRKGITWLLSGALILFTGYLTLTGAAAESADTLSASLTRSAIAAAVPVVGSIISEAGSSLLAGASLLKNTVGIGGMLGVLAVCLAPFVTLGIQYLFLKLAAFFSDILGAAISDYVHALSSACGLVLGMVGTCALVLLVSVSSSVSVVIS